MSRLDPVRTRLIAAALFALSFAATTVRAQDVVAVEPAIEAPDTTTVPIATVPHADGSASLSVPPAIETPPVEAQRSDSAETEAAAQDDGPLGASVELETGVGVVFSFNAYGPGVAPLSMVQLALPVSDRVWLYVGGDVGASASDSLEIRSADGEVVARQSESSGFGVGAVAGVRIHLDDVRVGAVTPVVRAGATIGFGENSGTMSSSSYLAAGGALSAGARLTLSRELAFAGEVGANVTYHTSSTENRWEQWDGTTGESTTDSDGVRVSTFARVMLVMRF